MLLPGGSASVGLAVPDQAACVYDSRRKIAVTQAGARCAQGHRFADNASGLIDFTAVVGEAGPPGHAPGIPKRSWLRRLRRGLLAAGCAAYPVVLALLLPLGYLVGRWLQPLPWPDVRTDPARL